LDSTFGTIQLSDKKEMTQAIKLKLAAILIMPSFWFFPLNELSKFKRKIELKAFKKIMIFTF
jgi:hypothetical protein